MQPIYALEDTISQLHYIHHLREIFRIEWLLSPSWFVFHKDDWFLEICLISVLFLNNLHLILNQAKVQITQMNNVLIT